MSKHPMTKRVFEDAYNQALYDLGRDEQLEQVQERLEDFVEEFSYRGHNEAANYELRLFLSNFKSYMRPTQEDNQ